MITSREYDLLCKVTDELRTATEALYTAGVTGDIKEAARQFVVAEDAWEAFIIRLVEDTAADVDAWIEWGGGKRPVGCNEPIEIRFRNGEEHRAPPVHHYEWRHLNKWSDIIAYRVVN